MVRGFAGEIPGLKPATVAFRVNPAAAEGCRGFDPVSFAVESRDDLQGWAAWAVAASTNGPVPHVRTLCVNKHRYLLPKHLGTVARHKPGIRTLRCDDDRPTSPAD